MSTPHPELELFSYSTSPYGQKVGCYLSYKDIDYTFIPVNPMTSEELKFTDQTQVPVLRVGDEWRIESTEIGLWLDELYPEKPLLPSDAAQRQKLMEIDQWVSDKLYPAFFRPLVDWSYNPVRSCKNGWRMSAPLCESGSVPGYVRWGYPVIVKRLGFIRHMLRHTDMSEPFPDMVRRLEGDFIERLQGASYLGGSDVPTLADFSAYPALAQKYLVGVKEKRNFVDNPIIATWCKNVAAHFNGHPFLFSEQFIIEEIN